MLCPMCLEEVKFDDNNICPKCKQPAPTMYVRDYASYPPVVVNAVGFRAHGKTVYFAALFHAMRHLSRSWPSFFATPLDDRAIDTVKMNVQALATGRLPEATPKNFPMPTVVRINGILCRPNCSLLFYDTSGESFRKPSEYVTYAGFLRRAQTALFLISIPDLDADPAQDMNDLIGAYTVGMGELGTDTQNQHLVVVYTKADELKPRFDNGWGDILNYLLGPSETELANPRKYARQMRRISERLTDFTSHELDAQHFLAAARSSFRSVSFSVVSALGARPQGSELSVKVASRRVIDPLLWTMERSRPEWRQKLSGVF